MKKHFYSHLIEVDSFATTLGELDLSETQRSELVSLAEENMHHTVLDLILSELSEKDKQTFLAHLAEEKHDAIWHLLKQKVADIETKIQKTADDLKKKLHDDIKSIKKD